MLLSDLQMICINHGLLEEVEQIFLSVPSCMMYLYAMFLKSESRPVSVS